eukprot:SM010442S14108  [mRNA]  locus=s10442:97:470:- [translate_table: standard]
MAQAPARPPSRQSAGRHDRLPFSRHTARARLQPWCGHGGVGLC